jgi:hypothetical protein
MREVKAILAIYNLTDKNFATDFASNYIIGHSNSSLGVENVMLIAATLKQDMNSKHYLENIILRIQTLIETVLRLLIADKCQLYSSLSENRCKGIKNI